MDEVDLSGYAGQVGDLIVATASVTATDRAGGEGQVEQEKAV